MSDKDRNIVLILIVVGFLIWASYQIGKLNGFEEAVRKISEVTG